MGDRYWGGLIRVKLGKFLQGFKYYITDNIGGERVGGLRRAM